MKKIFKSLFWVVSFVLFAFFIMNVSTLNNKSSNINFKNSIQKYQNVENTLTTNNKKSIEDYLKPKEVYEKFNINVKLEHHYLNETNNNIYIANKTGLYKLDLDSKKFVNVYNGNVRISFVHEINYQIYVGSKEGLFTLNIYSKKLTKISNKNFAKLRLSAEEEENILRKAQEYKKIYAIGKSGLFLLNRFDNKISQFSLNNSEGFYYEKNNSFYIGGKNGLYLYNERTKDFEIIVDENLALGFFKKIRGVFYSGGIHGFSKLINENGKYKLHKLAQGNFQNGFIREIDNDIYIGNKDGLFILKNEKLERINRINFKGGFIKKIKGSIYAGTFDKKLLIINNKSKMLRDYPIKRQWDFVKAVNGVVFVGNENGLFILNKNRDLFKVYKSIGKGLINSIEGTIYFGTSEGLYTYDGPLQNKNEFDNFENNLKRVYSKSMVGGFVEKINNFTYFSSVEKGLNIILHERNNSIVKALEDITFANGFMQKIDNNVYIGKKDGLFTFDNSDNSLKKVLSLNLENSFMKKIKNNVFIVNQEGLHTYDQSSKKATKVVDENFQNGFIKEVDNEIYLGNENGLFIYNLIKKSLLKLSKINLQGGSAGELNGRYFLFSPKEGFFNISKKRERSSLIFDDEKFIEDVLYKKVNILELEKHKIVMKIKEGENEDFIPVVSQSKLIEKVKKIAPKFLIKFEAPVKKEKRILLKRPGALTWEKKSLLNPMTSISSKLPTKKPSYKGAKDGALYINVGEGKFVNNFVNREYLENLKIKFHSKNNSYDLKDINKDTQGLKIYNLESNELFDLKFTIKDPIQYYWANSKSSTQELTSKLRGISNLDKLVALPTSDYKIKFKISPNPNKFFLEIIDLKNINQNLYFTYLIDGQKIKKQLMKSENGEYKIELRFQQQIQLYANPKDGFVWDNGKYNKEAQEINLNYPDSNDVLAKEEDIPLKEKNVALIVVPSIAGVLILIAIAFVLVKK